MLIRPKLFLKFLALCGIPLVLLAIFTYWNNVRAARSVLRSDVSAGLATVSAELNECLTERENDLIQLARSAALRDFIREKAKQSPSPADQDNLLNNLKVELAPVMSHTHFASLIIYDNGHQPMFWVERKQGEQERIDLVFHDKNFPSRLAKPDDRAAAANTVSRSPLSITASGVSSKLTTIIPARDSGEPPLGKMVAEQDLAALFSEAAKRWEVVPFTTDAKTAPVSRGVVILDSSGRILYHPNQTLLHQPVTEAMAYFSSVAQRMLSHQAGVQTFTSATGDESEAAFAVFPALDVSIATTRNAHPALAAARQAGWVVLMASILLGLVAALVFTRYWQRKARGIERLTEGMAEIKKGKLDHRIEVQSSVDMRPLAEDVNLLTARLREQVSREAEARQFQSFARLSAMLTHDLKNAIAALSLIVGNMERHFDDQNFRADAMKSLNIATQNLSSLVDRLTSPVATLSGEYRRPQPTDLIPLLQREISITAEPVRGTHRVESRLPPSLFALVDAERISKVVENLIINALEAMAGKRGCLTIDAGTTEDGKVFFSVSDTGAGMSREFIERRLYHAFATTKKKGVGLGLYTCREVVRAHGGFIDVNSVEGAGTTFRVVLPSAQSGGQNKTTEELAG